MSFGIQIEVSPGNALPIVAQVEGALGKIEQMGPRVGAAISQGLQQGSAAAERAKASAAGLSQQLDAMTNAAAPFKAMADAMQREADMLDQIRGPMQQYQRDLETINALYDKGKISATQYMDQRDRMQQSVGIRAPSSRPPEERGNMIEGSLGQSVAGQFGEAGSVLGSVASGAAIEAAAVAGLVMELGALGDEYIELSNDALRLTGGIGSTDAVLGQQLEAADQMHASLESQMELSIAVKERTDDLGLSYAKQSELTKALGEDAKLSSQSMQSAASMLDRFSVALASGQDAGRALTLIFREFPAVAEDLEHHFGTTAKGIADMAKKGQLSMQDFVDAMTDAGATAERDDKFSKVAETMGDAWQHFKDTMVTSVGQAVASSGALQGIESIIKELGSAVQFAAPLFSVLGEGVRELTLAMRTLMLPVTLANDALRSLFGLDELEAQTKAYQGAIVDLTTATKGYDEAIRIADEAQQDFDSHLSIEEVMGGLAKGTLDLTDAYYALAGSMTEWAKQDKAAQAILDAATKQYTDAGTAALNYANAADKVRAAIQGIINLRHAPGGADNPFDPSNPLGADYSTMHVSIPGASPKPVHDFNSPFANELTTDSLKSYQLMTKGQQNILDQSAAKTREATDANYAYGGVLDEASKKVEDHNNKLRDLSEALADTSLSTQQHAELLKMYNQELGETAKHVTTVAKAHDELASSLANATNAPGISARAFGLSGAMQLPDLATTEALDQFRPRSGYGITPGLHLASEDTAGQDARLKEAMSLYEQTRSSADKYNDEADKIAANDQLRDDLKVKALDNLAERYGAVVDPMKKYADQIDVLDAMQARGAVSADQYAASMKKISDEERDYRLQSGQGSIGDAFQSQFEKMAKDGGNAGQLMATTFSSAIGEMNTALESLATTGKVTWSSLEQSLEKSLVDMSLKLAESQIFKWLSGALGGSSGGDGSVNTSGVSAIEGSGANLGSDIFGAAKVAGSIIGGLFADGGDVMIPHAANGYSGRIGGYGGTDSKLFAAMVTPGEHVAIRTPEQQLAAGRASSQPTQVHVIVPDNKRALLKTAGSADGQRQVINTMMRNKSALRGLLK